MDCCHCLSAIEKETQDNQGNNIIGPEHVRTQDIQKLFSRSSCLLNYAKPSDISVKLDT